MLCSEVLGEKSSEAGLASGGDCTLAVLGDGGVSEAELVFFCIAGVISSALFDSTVSELCVIIGEIWGCSMVGVGSVGSAAAGWGTVFPVVVVASCRKEGIANCSLKFVKRSFAVRSIIVRAGSFTLVSKFSWMESSTKEL